MFVQQTWLPALMFAKRQLEEIFCDMMGVRLFAEAYLHAFAYLLSPCLPGERSPVYPTIQTRVAILLQAAIHMGLAPPEGYADLFDSQPEPSSPVVKLLVSIADAAVSVLVPSALQEAIGFADGKGAPRKSVVHVADIGRGYRMVIPAAGKATLADLVNAGWECFHDASLWGDIMQVHQQDRHRVLYDLVLKSLEVSEYSERIGVP